MKREAGNDGCLVRPETPVKVNVLVTKSCLTLETPWTVTRQAPQSMRFSRQEYWSGLPFLSPEDLPDPRIEPGSPALQADSSEPPRDHGGRGTQSYWENSCSQKNTYLRAIPSKMQGIGG